MLIDANLMVGRSPLLPHAIAEEEAPEVLRYYGIDKAIVYHAAAKYYDPIMGNERILQFSKKTSNFFPCIVLSHSYKSHSGNWDSFLEMIAVNHIKFVRIFPTEHGYAFNSVLTDELFSVAAAAGVTIMLDMEEITSSDTYFAELCQKYPTLHIIITRCLHRKNFNIEYYLEHFKNTYIESSITNNWLFYETMVRRHGAARFVWGSSMPYNNAGCSISMLAYADISQADRELISSQNIMGLL